jgi:hypothetical protein
MGDFVSGVRCNFWWCGREEVGALEMIGEGKVRVMDRVTCLCLCLCLFISRVTRLLGLVTYLPTACMFASLLTYLTTA